MPFKGHPEIKLPFVFYEVPWTNPVLGPTIFTDRFWDDKEHWLPPDAGVVYRSTHPYFGPMPAPTVGPRIGSLRAWREGLDYERWLKGGYRHHPCWDVGNNHVGVKLGFKSHRLNVGEPGKTGLELGFVSSPPPHTLVTVGLFGLELGFLSEGPLPTVGLFGLELGFLSSPVRLIPTGLFGLQLGFTSHPSPDIQDAKFGLELGFVSSPPPHTLVTVGLFGLELGWVTVPPGGAATACCPNLIPLTLTATVAGEGSTPIVFDPVTLDWRGSLVLGCGGTLNIRMSCEAFPATGLQVSLGWTAMVYNTNFATVTGGCSSPWSSVTSCTPGGFPPVGCPTSFDVTITG